jgi:DNA invertase Pin-like site-specific DNA recombinase
VEERKTLRMIGLTRKSRGEDEGTHADQKRRIEHEIARHDDMKLLTPVRHEHKVSGGKGDWRSKEIGKAIQDVKDRKADGIVVTETDRITRYGWKAAAEIWEAMEEAGVVFITTAGIDSRDEESEFTFGLEALIARRQYRSYLRRSNDGRERAVLEHGVHGGDEDPLGYEFTDRADGSRNAKGKPKHGPLKPNTVKSRKHYAGGEVVPLEDLSCEAAHIRPGFEAAAEDKPWSEIVRLLGVRSRGNAREILTNKVYLGIAYSGEYEKADAHPALVDKVLFDRVQRKLKKRERSAAYAKKGEPREGSLLNGKILRCGNCGLSLTADTGASGKGYRCRSPRTVCPAGVSIQAKTVEPLVLGAALNWHATLSPPYRSHTANMIPGRAAELRAAEEKLAEVDEMEADPDMDAVTYAKARAKAQARVNEATAALAEAEAANGWHGMSTEAVQRRLFGRVLGEDLTLTAPVEELRSVAEGREFVKAMVSATVAPAGRGRHVPPEARVGIEFLRPEGWEEIDAKLAAGSRVQGAGRGDDRGGSPGTAGGGADRRLDAPEPHD